MGAAFRGARERRKEAVAVIVEALPSYETYAIVNFRCHHVRLNFGKLLLLLPSRILTGL